MPEHVITRRDDRPTEGYLTAYLASEPARPVRMFLPSDYQPKYAYPLLALFHAAGEDEDTAARLVTRLSPRNYVAVSLRGSVPVGHSAIGCPQFTWSQSSRKDRSYLLESLDHACQNYHIHSERIYLVGIGEGVSAAYRLGLAMGGRIAGIVALNGRLPEASRRPYTQLPGVRGMRIFIGHGTNNSIVPVEAAHSAHRLLDSAEADVHLATYPTTHCLHPNMLRDVNRWIMGAMNPDFENLTPTNLLQ